MRKRVIVLGTGLVGSAIVKDLATSYQVTAADISAENLESGKKTGRKPEVCI